MALSIHSRASPFSSLFSNYIKYCLSFIFSSSTLFDQLSGQLESLCQTTSAIAILTKTEASAQMRIYQETTRWPLIQDMPLISSLIQKSWEGTELVGIISLNRLARQYIIDKQMNLNSSCYPAYQKTPIFCFLKNWILLDLKLAKKEGLKCWLRSRLQFRAFRTASRVMIILEGVLRELASIQAVYLVSRPLSCYDINFQSQFYQYQASLRKRRLVQADPNSSSLARSLGKFRICSKCCLRECWMSEESRSMSSSRQAASWYSVVTQARIRLNFLLGISKASYPSQAGLRQSSTSYVPRILAPIMAWITSISPLQYVSQVINFLIPLVVLFDAENCQRAASSLDSQSWKDFSFRNVQNQSSRLSVKSEKQVKARAFLIYLMGKQLKAQLMSQGCPAKVHTIVLRNNFLGIQSRLVKSYIKNCCQSYKIQAVSCASLLFKSICFLHILLNQSCRRVKKGKIRMHGKVVKQALSS